MWLASTRPARWECVVSFTQRVSLGGSHAIFERVDANTLGLRRVLCAIANVLCLELFLVLVETGTLYNVDSAAV